MRRLGAFCCDVCQCPVDDSEVRLVVVVGEKDEAAFAEAFGFRSTSNKVYPCDGCHQKLIAKKYDILKREREARLLSLRTTYENARDTARLIEPNSSSYADEVRRHRREIIEAMRSNGKLGVFGGGSD